MSYSLIRCFKIGDYSRYDTSKNNSEIKNELYKFLIFVPSAVNFRGGHYQNKNEYMYFTDTDINNFAKLFDFVEQFKLHDSQILSGYLRYMTMYGRYYTLTEYGRYTIAQEMIKRDYVFSSAFSTALVKKFDKEAIEEYKYRRNCYFEILLKKMANYLLKIPYNMQTSNVLAHLPLLQFTPESDIIYTNEPNLKLYIRNKRYPKEFDVKNRVILLKDGKITKCIDNPTLISLKGFQVFSDKERLYLYRGVMPYMDDDDDYIGTTPESIIPLSKDQLNIIKYLSSIPCN